METKFDPKAKVKQGQLNTAPDGKQPNREHTNIDFSQHTHRKQEPFAYDVDVPCKSGSEQVEEALFNMANEKEN